MTLSGCILSFRLSAWSVFSDPPFTSIIISLSFLLSTAALVAPSHRGDTFHGACNVLATLEPGLVQEMEDLHGITEDGAYYFVEQNGTLVLAWGFRSNGPYPGNQNVIEFCTER